MQQITVMFDLDSRVFDLLKQAAAQRGISAADFMRHAVSRDLLAQPQVVTNEKAPQVLAGPSG
ncbi:hypothetical protein [Cognatishimia sp. WU-CL00825]|uniref:hypothetical protein n=1 Tax=Cognatishimia sp. WU-CL00825 TaxID=3127658 RepID=UPI00336559FE